jgi:hypothetical protein
MNPRQQLLLLFRRMSQTGLLKINFPSGDAGTPGEYNYYTGLQYMRAARAIVPLSRRIN